MGARRKYGPIDPPAVAVVGARGSKPVMGAPPTVADIGWVGDIGTRAHYVDAAYYDKTYAGRSEDIDFYVRLARGERSVLEYGVGTGRIAIPIAREGSRVVGVDLSPTMLAALRARVAEEPPEVRKRIRAVKGDMREVSVGQKFGLVLSTFSTFMHLYERADVERFLARVRAHLVPGGRFVFDLGMPNPGDLGADPDRSYGASPIRHPTLEQRTRYAERFDYDPIRQVLLVQMDFQPERGEAFTVPLSHRQFFPRELEALLHYNGFDRIEMTGDYTDAPAGPDTQVLVVSSRLRRLAGRRRRT